MAEIGRLNNHLVRDCVEGIKPERFLKLGIQLYLRGLSLTNAIFILDKFGGGCREVRKYPEQPGARRKIPINVAPISGAKNAVPTNVSTRLSTFAAVI